MDGRDYLCNYYEELDRENYYHTIIRERRIINVTDKRRLAGLISLTGKYATMDLYDIDPQNYVTYLRQIAYVNELLWQHINRVGRPRAVIVRG